VQARNLGSRHWRNRAGGAISGWLDRGDYGGERQNDYHFAGGRDSYRRKVSYLVEEISHACDQFCGSGWGCEWTCWRCRVFSWRRSSRFVRDCGDSEHHSRPSGPAQTFANYVNAKARVFENQGRTISPCSTPTTPRPLDWRGEREGS